MRRSCRARLRTLSQIPVYQSSSLPPEACRSVDDVGVEFQRLFILGDDGHVGEVVGTPVTALCSSVTGTETMAATSVAMPAVQTSHAFLQKTPHCVGDFQPPYLGHTYPDYVFWRCPSAIVVELSESFRQDDRVRIHDTAWTRIRRPCHDRLRRSGKSVQELNAHQQGEVLVHRVVAVVDIGPAVFAELDLERDLSGRTQPPYVLTDEELRCRNGVVAAIDRNAFLEVQMDRVIPSAAAVDKGPVLDGSWLLVLELNAVCVHRMRLAVIDHDGPREAVLRRTIGDARAGVGLDRIAIARSAPLDRARTHRRDDRNLLRQHVRNLARVRIGCPEGDGRVIDALDLADDPELHDRANRWVVGDASQGLRQRHLSVGLAAVRLLQGIDQERHVADPEPAEVDNDVIALGGALLVERG